MYDVTIIGAGVVGGMIARELSSTQLTVNEIAEKLGFYDGAHLAKAYKKFKGTNLKYTQKDVKIFDSTYLH